MAQLEKDNKTALCSAIRTSRYSQKVVSLLRDMSDDLYRTDSEDLMRSFEAGMDEDLRNVFKELFADVDYKNPMEAEEILRQVIDYLKGIEEISFVVPILPKKEFVKRLYDWCAENVTDEVLLDFTTNRLMESGLLMVYKGKYFKYSLEELLDEYFKEHNFDHKLENKPEQKTEPKQVQPQQQAGPSEPPQKIEELPDNNNVVNGAFGGAKRREQSESTYGNPQGEKDISQGGQNG